MSDNLPLSRFPLLQTGSVDESRDALARVYADGRLSPVGGAEDFAQVFNLAPLGRVTLTAMSWSVGMTFEAPSLDGCFDFTSVLHGCSEARVGQTLLVADQTCGVVMSPSRSIFLRWEESLASLNAKISREVLESHLISFVGVELTEPLEFEPGLRFVGGVVTATQLIRHIAKEINRDATLLTTPLVAEQFSEAVLTTLLYAQPHNYSAQLVRAVESSGMTYVRRAEEYIEAHCDRPITAQLLAKVVGVSLRSLFEGFRRCRNYTPMEHLRRVRLERVRRALLTSSDGTLIREIAMKWGFSNLGRFSAQYRKRFGESPSDTLRNNADNL